VLETTPGVLAQPAVDLSSCGRRQAVRLGVFGLYALTFAVQLGVDALVLAFVPESF